MKMGFIGDIHGNFGAYVQIVELLKQHGAEATIQVGDYGIGFGDAGRDPIGMQSTHEMDARYGPFYRSYYTEDEHRATENHRFIRGNHDNPASCKVNPRWIQDGTVWNNVFCVGGAYSIDKDMRTANWDWWEDEELSWQDLSTIIDIYATVKPNVVVTHDCPEEVARSSYHFYDKTRFPSRTRDALQAMLEIHAPKYWVYGHWHTARHLVYNETHFYGLAINQGLILEV